VATHQRFPLTGSHRAVACNACHEKDARGVRRFDGVNRQCRGCHEAPHGRQFARAREKSCTACHRGDATTFRIEPFDHARKAGYPLTGAHAQATCNACHRSDQAGVRRYRGTATACASCHTDPHRGQFRRNGATDCEACHGSTVAWNDMEFDHTRQTRFPLDRAHEQVACDRCHFSVKQPDGARVVQYRPLGTQCRDCHEFDKR
jgi:hypothetical protein